MSLGVCALLILLCNVWCLISGTSVMIPDVAVKCAEEALLPCKALQDSSVSYQTASWYKMAGDSKGIAWEVLDVEPHYPQEAGGSLELSNDTSFSLRIKNATSQNSGTYKCTSGGQNGERNLSSTVTLKVTGCPGIEEDKLSKYKGELLMLTCLGIFYLLLIFFTCTCLRKESISPNYQKTRPDMKHMLTLMNIHEITTFQHLNTDNTCKNELTSSFV
ncbi:CD83 antigen-like [Cyanistes caeruleus]|uniref:CD83 molecule n=1 Tax=Cyanistes caeruleus TaxID=156563 RepID=A0A8C0Z7Z2_CYACU|nr:CD83 antigen [Cyanistes caeruleus]XP_023802087.1 CD83 antigen-like [Cyanistes caeruleus]